MPLRHGSLAVEREGEGEETWCLQGYSRGPSGVCLVTLCLKRATVIKRNISIVVAQIEKKQAAARRGKEAEGSHSLITALAAQHLCGTCGRKVQLSCG